MEESEGVSRMRVVGDGCTRVWDEIWQRQPLLFWSFR
jgi:hypothetical protein